MYEVVYSRRAVETFDIIQEQISNKWGEKYSDIFEQRVLKIISLLELSPFIYELIDQDLNLYRCVVHKNCSMYYVVNHYKITIHYFFDNRQEPIS